VLCAAQLFNVSADQLTRDELELEIDDQLSEGVKE
jgi:hypothetical protein